jgi:AGZA family xanthine/uracil permease-like MFS transporter
MPLAFSIAEGIALGMVVYAAFHIGSGRARSVTPLAYVLAVLCLLHLIFR